ncbi:hypothetical protein SIN8267_02476 [Sinobacterium norvegicum]|uniref:Uncharacterized protein n=1 Tax=Sinobacterium norvegicum TaxID=1641715 RepID=A0ABM9AHY2_9GAMM|nr:NAD(P)/FAD-dependent oxidoreductase [Sinobacterium norvegicum]CAH0992357.1 hypothetical protein SIN8267_02476 [Sinobacterium norvegicum]
MNNYDVIIIGAGHNGLACSIELAKTGKKVLVLEANKHFGGMAACEEFHPGFKRSLVNQLSQLNQATIDRLNLEQHGYRSAATVGTSIIGDEGGDEFRRIDISRQGINGAQSNENDDYRALRRLLQRFAKLMATTWSQKPPRIGSGQWADNKALGLFGLKLRLLGKADMREFTRMIALPAQDLMDEYFTDPLLKAGLSWDMVIGNKLAPRSPNNAVLNLLHRMAGDDHHLPAENIRIAANGARDLTDALVASAKAYGVTLQGASRVKQVTVAEHAVTGVTLLDGQQFHANNVIANADSKMAVMNLVGAKHFDIHFSHRINRIRNQGMVAKLTLAVSQLPTFRGFPDLTNRLIICPSMSYLEQSFDRAKYGEFGDKFGLEIFTPSLHDAAMAPAGKHLLSINVQYLPYLDDEQNDDQRPAMLEKILAVLEHYSPGIKETIEAAELLTPRDIAIEYNNLGGHWHHSELSIDQWWMNRPTYGASQYKTPLPGFFLCGAGNHPGGGIMGAAGINAAKEVLAND